MGNEGRFRIAVQHGSSGYFGEVVLSVKVVVGGSGVDIQWASGAEKWSVAIVLGIHYAIEHVRGIPLDSGIVVDVISVEEHEVDSSQMVMVFVAAQALWNALDVMPDRCPELRLDEGVFVFPK